VDREPAPAGATTPASPALTTTDFAVAAPGGTVDYLESDSGADTLSSGASADRPREGKGVGLVVGGYEILGTLGQGAMGVVYRARQRGLKRVVALKMISAGAHATANQLARFRAEAEAVAKLQHPNIVQIHEVGEHEGRPFFSLEFVDGGSLDSKIKGTPQPPRQAAEIVRTLALAMDYAHQHHIIHRDLKPANILLQRKQTTEHPEHTEKQRKLARSSSSSVFSVFSVVDFVPKIADFGLAKSLEDESVHTQTGTIVGTPSYMSPEQAGGKTKEIGPPTDIYALGAILYDLLTGRPPFRGTSMWDTVAQVKTQEPVAPRQLQPRIPVDLETICLKCLQKEPGKRYATAAELAEDLRRFLAGEPIIARPVSTPERLVRWCRRNPVLALVGGIAAALLLAWAGTSTFMYFEIKAEKEATEVQRDRAETNEQLANEKKELAEKREAEAKVQRKRAEKNAASLRRLFADDIVRVHYLVEQMSAELKPKGSATPSPEAAATRQKFLALVRRTTNGMAREFQKAGPGISDYSMVLVFQRMGDLLCYLEQPEDSLPWYRLGVDLARQFARERASDIKVRGNLAFMLNRLGDALLEAQGDAPAAAACFSEAFTLNEYVLANLPRHLDGDEQKRMAKDARQYKQKYFVNLVERSANLMWDPAGTRKALEAALPKWKAQADANPADADSLSVVAQTHSLLGDACSWSANWEEARKHHEEAVRICASLVKNRPKEPTFGSDLAYCCCAFGDAYLRHGQPEEARKLYAKALPLAEAAFTRYAKAGVLTVLIQCYERQGLLLLHDKKPEQAREYFIRVLPRWKTLSALKPNYPSWQAAECVALARCGEYIHAQVKVKALLAKWPRQPEAVIEAARCLALCSANPAGDKQAALNQAVQLLQRAVKQGYRNVLALQTEPEWQFLAADPGFRKLLEQVKQAKTP
jgi:serine/threonine-protein kinase